jgi:N-acetylmuramic acid 6-phosphate etherase
MEQCFPREMPRCPAKNSANLFAPHDSGFVEEARDGMRRLRPGVNGLPAKRVFPAALVRIVALPGYTSSMPSRPTKARRSARLRPEERSTERRNPASRNLDAMSALEIVRLMNREDRKVAGAVGRELPRIAEAVEVIVRAIRGGGRLIYVGAGTSGRLAILDAVELPPTYGIGADVVIPLIAGGKKAVMASAEGAEDSAGDAVGDLRAVRLRRRDVVAGIAASGTTPYVLAALRFARHRRAATIALTANRHSPVAKLADISIAAEVGAEVVTGSTRMKAGTAQKMVLNMLSTATMVRLGHTYENWMMDMLMTNQKLTERGLRILVAASGAKLAAAEEALRQSGHNLRVALLMLKHNVSAAAARRKLSMARGNLRVAITGR